MKYAFLFLIGSLSIVSCKQQALENAGGAAADTSLDTVFEDIDITKAKELMEKQPLLVLVDVRTPEEIAAGKIGNALEIDYSAPDFAQKISELDKNTPYLVYCAAGGRSKSAMEQMKQSGFTHVYNLTDGYNGWAQSGQTR